jgi:hypothetical protein
MRKTNNGWQALDAAAGVFWREYRFSGKAVATSLTFRGADGKLVVVSPPCGADEEAFAALEKEGGVGALIANNTFHHLGQKAWRARFPAAKSYAPPGAVAVLAKKSGLDYRPLSELALPPSVRWTDAPGYKNGETILRIGAESGTVWYTGDLLANISKLPPPPVRWLFTWTGSAPGYKLFAPAKWMLVKDTQALKAWALELLAQDPPACVVTAHGKPVQGSDVAAKTREQLQRL